VRVEGAYDMETFVILDVRPTCGAGCELRLEAKKEEVCVSECLRTVTYPPARPGQAKPSQAKEGTDRRTDEETRKTNQAE
jgi:hypothetical protein